jgi:RHS repeat-associated protein
VNAAQSLAASYRYDPFGNLISSSGAYATNNVYRFSSKEVHLNSGMYYYLYRFYDPNLQRWINLDPIGEPGFEASRALGRGRRHRAEANLYHFVRNNSPNAVDRFGLDAPWDLCVWLEEEIFEISDELLVDSDPDAVAEMLALQAMFDEYCKPPRRPPPPPPPAPKPLGKPYYIPDFPVCNPWNSTINNPTWTPPGWHPSPGVIGVLIIGGGAVVLGAGALLAE